MMCLVACEQNAPKDPNQTDVNKDTHAPQLSMSEIATTIYGDEYQIRVTSKTTWRAQSNKKWVTLDMKMWTGDTIVKIKVAEGINSDTARILFNNEAGSKFLIVYRTVQGKANGGFSVAENKQVKFAPGNLQYQPSTDTWRFAEHQYDFVGEDNDSLFYYYSYSGWIDLFGWGTGNNPTNTSTDDNDYSTFVDWGTNKIGSYAANTWRTLSAEEWEYLFYHRENEKTWLLWRPAIVNGQPGLVVLPDNTLVPLDFNAKNTYSSAEWEKLESVGALFLPAAGKKASWQIGTSFGKEGYYWTCTPDTQKNYAHYVHFQDGLYYDPSPENRSNHYSVRLVKDIK